jgi:hypothetical protein
VSKKPKPKQALDEYGIPFDQRATKGPDGGRPEPAARDVQPPDLAREPRILDRFADELLRTGVVGEPNILLLIYLVCATRLFERVVSLALKGPSAGGKSYLLDRVLDYFPASAYYRLSGMSEHAMVYDDEPLVHRMLVIYEATGMAGELQAYFVRSLLSEGHLVYVTVVKAKEGPTKKIIDRPGPTGLLTTTTAVHLHPENETRLISVTITDTADQTRAIMLAQAGLAPKADLKPWHELQAWLANTRASVRVPYAEDLARSIPPVAVRLRRDFPAVLALIQAHALLHQFSRDRDADGAVVATLDDYAVVREIVAQFIGEAVERTIPETVRETVAAVAELTRSSADASVSAVGSRLGLDKSSASRRVRVAIDRGVLKNLEDSRGRASRIVLGDPLPEDTTILPAVEDLERLHGCSTPRGDSPEAASSASSQSEDSTIPSERPATVQPSLFAAVDATARAAREAAAAAASQDGEPSGTDEAAEAEDSSGQEAPILYGTPLTPPRLCPNCGRLHPVGTTCGWVDNTPTNQGFMA